MSTTDLPPEPWLAPWFQHPGRTELPSGHHLRPLRAADSGLPGLPATFDLSWAVAAVASRSAFVYGVFDDEEGAVLGLVHLAPGPPDHDVDVRWTVAGCPRLAVGIAGYLPGWLERCWPFVRPAISAD
ncbi:hypothetical protein ABFT23_04380 [Nocardioides sp. C4-1]|uniref:hypothetical protein n=1 Tax=Nocardioides sp. C4-1 TaxID=3151851 RepID=UPI0032639782